MRGVQRIDYRGSRTYQFERGWPGFKSAKTWTGIWAKPKAGSRNIIEK